MRASKVFLKEWEWSLARVDLAANSTRNIIHTEVDGTIFCSGTESLKCGNETHVRLLLGDKSNCDMAVVVSFFRFFKGTGKLARFEVTADILRKNLKDPFPGSFLIVGLIWAKGIEDGLV